MATKNKIRIDEQSIDLTIYNFNKELGHVNKKTIRFYKARNKKCKEEYKLIATLKLTRAQRTLLTAFVNSLNNDKK